ncbi:MAG: RrF2 family transcriptional regulator [Microthrixaceae bacterium]
MRISSKVDYAVRACTELAVRSPTRASGATKGELLGEAQGIPTKYLENILSELRRSGVVGSQRGADGGYWLARPADKISVADVIRAVEGPLADVRGEAPEQLDYVGPAKSLERVWLATRASVRSVLEQVSLADIVADDLPKPVVRLLDDPEAWVRR